MKKAVGDEAARMSFVTTAARPRDTAHTETDDESVNGDGLFKVAACL